MDNYSQKLHNRSSSGSQVLPSHHPPSEGVSLELTPSTNGGSQRVVSEGEIEASIERDLENQGIEEVS